MAAGADSSLTIATAPRPTASRRKAFPSAFAPCNAKKSARGCTLRESQVTCRISNSSAAAGTLASIPLSKSSNFMFRVETRDDDELWLRSSAWFGLVLLVSSIWLNPLLILIPESRAWLRFFLERCPELHGDFRAAFDFRARGRRLLYCKIAATQDGIESQPQRNLCYFAHGLPAEVRHFYVAA